MGNPAQIEKVIRCEIEMLEGSGRETRDYGMSPSRIINRMQQLGAERMARELPKLKRTHRFQKILISKSTKLCKFGLCVCVCWHPQS